MDFIYYCSHKRFGCINQSESCTIDEGTRVVLKYTIWPGSCTHTWHLPSAYNLENGILESDGAWPIVGRIYCVVSLHK